MHSLSVCCTQAKAQVAYHKVIVQNIEASLTSLAGRLFKTKYDKRNMRTLHARRMSALTELHVAKQRFNGTVFEKRWRSFLVDIMGNSSDTILDIKIPREDLVVAVEESVGRRRVEAALRMLKLWATRKGWTLRFLGDVDEDVVVAPEVAGQDEEEKGEEEKGEEEKVEEETGEEAEKEKTEKGTCGNSVDDGMESMEALKALCNAIPGWSCE